MAAEQTGVDEAAFREYMKNPILYPTAFKDWMSDWYATNVPKLHVSQIFGFKLHSIYVADDVPANEAISTTAYGNMTTVGPTLENLANGFYIVMWGCFANVAATATTYMGVSADGDTPSGQREMLLNGTEALFSVGRLALVDFSQGDQTHTLQAKYKSNNGPATALQNRWLHALRVVTEDG